METLWQDLRYGFRMLARNPGFTVVAVLTLALGIGANTAIFSVVNAVLLRPLPYHDPESLVMVWETDSNRNVNEEWVSPPNFLDWSSQNRVFQHMAAFTVRSFNLSGVEEPQRLEGYRVSASLFPLLGVEPALGRAFQSDEDRFGGLRVVLLSHGLWQRRFGADPQVIGRTLTLNDESVTIMGVMPPGFSFPGREADLWVPMAFTATDKSTRGGHYLRVVGRLQPGITLDQAQAEMNTIARRLEREYPASNTGAGVNLVSLHEAVVSDVQPTLLVLLGAVGFMLLIVCANIANMLLARAVMREKEIAIRTALGAGRRRIVRQLLTENLLLALLGGVVGLLLALWGLDLLLLLNPGTIPRLEETSIDTQVLGFALGISLLTGIVFGSVPAMRVSSPDLNETLKEGGRRPAGASRHRLRSFLVLSEVALTLVLLIGAGLMINSFLRLQSIDPGFNPDNLLTMRVDLPGSKYAALHQRSMFYEQVLRNVESLPGVRSAGVISRLPLASQGGSVGLTIEGQLAPRAGEEQGANYRVISPSYFRTMGTPLLKGRDFSEQDTREAPRVVMINQAMARRYWPDKDPIGKRLKLGRVSSNNPWLTVVGVVGDLRQFELSTKPRPEIYLPYAQLHMFWAAPRALVVRTASDPMGVVAVVRGEIWAVDEDQPVSNIMSMEQVISESVAKPRLYSVLMGLFGAVALVLAAIGIYGVISYTVSQRTHEIGIRMALGAQPRDIFRLVVGQGMGLVLIGVGIGLAASLALTRFLESMLFGVSATDPATFAGVTLLLAAVALLACYIPARRATKVDPLIALRYE
jgi:putative ABC transport system permease protein